jgi:glucan biosynthesis protein C
MDLLFVAWARWFARVDLTVRPEGSFPRGRLLAVFALLLGAVSFLVRQGMPVGATFFSLQLAYFPSYVAMFFLGLVAWRQRWLEAIPDAAFRWARWAVGTIVLLPIILLTGAIASTGVTAFYGGLHWQALAYALWEPWVLVGMSILLVRWGQRRLNQPSRWWQGWSSASYVAYIIQPLVLVPAAILFQGTSWPVLDKFALVASLAIVTTYTLARGLRLISPVRAALG